MIVILGTATARPHTRDELLGLAREHVARSRAEPGCLSHEVTVSCDDPLRLVFVERWADRAAVDAHFAVPASRAFARDAARLVALPPELDLYDVPSP